MLQMSSSNIPFGGGDFCPLKPCPSSHVSPLAFRSIELQQVQETSPNIQISTTEGIRYRNLTPWDRSWGRSCGFFVEACNRGSAFTNDVICLVFRAPFCSQLDDTTSTYIPLTHPSPDFNFVAAPCTEKLHASGWSPAVCRFFEAGRHRNSTGESLDFKPGTALENLS